MRHQVRLLIPILALAAALSSIACSALAVPLTEPAKKAIDDELLRAKLMSNARLALKYCLQAQDKAAAYDPDPFYAGSIASCLAWAQVHLNDRAMACKHRAQALAHLRAVPSGHPRSGEVREMAAALDGGRAWSGC